MSYQFKHIGRIIVKKNQFSLDDIFSFAVDAGAEDIEEVGDEVFIYTEQHDLMKIKDQLFQKGLEIMEAELIREPLTTIEVSENDKLGKIENFVNTLEELDDVQKVYTNLQ